jgi:hypothetical protein
MDVQTTVLDLIFGLWKARILYAGLRLGIIDALNHSRKSALQITEQLGLDPALGYRLLRAMASIGLLEEGAQRFFALSPAGLLLCSDAPESLRDIALLQDGPEHTAIWDHLPAMVRDGRQSGFVRHFGHSPFAHADTNPEYGKVFDVAMTAYSSLQAKAFVEALSAWNFPKAISVCDIGGGQGRLLCAVLEARREWSGVVLERPGVLKDGESLWGEKLRLSGRCSYVPGDMFLEAPQANLYLLKLILHDWEDDACVKLLTNARRAACPESRLFIIEHVIPGPETPHFAKLYDIHMMCWGTGRERTVVEYASLLREAGWRFTGLHPMPSVGMSIVAARGAGD